MNTRFDGPIFTHPIHAGLRAKARETYDAAYDVPHGPIPAKIIPATTRTNLRLAYWPHHLRVILSVAVDGGPAVTCTLGEFLADNAETLPPEYRQAIGDLTIGETFVSGGGAAPWWSVTRTA